MRSGSPGSPNDSVTSPRRRRPRPDDRRRRVLLTPRAVRVRQDDHAADDRRIRVPHRRVADPIHGKEMGLEPPNRRPVNTVFQSYALFPHMTVADNVAFGLKMRRLGGVRGRRPGAARSRHGAALAPLGGQTDPALGWAAAAGGARQGARQRTRGPASRRAARSARPQAAPGDAARIERPPGPRRHHVHLRHPRPGRGVDHV